MKKKYIGVIGDMNPIEHWGGVVYRDQYGDRMWYFQSYDGEDEDMVSVYHVDIPDDVFEELDWVDWEAVASQFSDEYTIDQMREFGRSADPIARASVVEEGARYSGWHELDQSPQEMTIRKAEAKYGRAVDAAHRAAQKAARARANTRASSSQSIKTIKNRLLR